MTAQTNFACMLMKAMTIEIQDIPMPTVGAGDVLIKVECTGICGSDLHNYSHGGVGKDLIKGPLILGHESAGTVVEIGLNVTSVKPGDHVAIEPNSATIVKGEKPIYAGAFVKLHYSQLKEATLSQYYACDEDYVAQIPASLSWEEAGCIQPLAVAIQLAKRAKFSAGQTLAVFGCGPLGNLVMATAKAYGLSKILAFDVLQSRIDFAEQQWANYVALPPRKPEGQEYSEWAEAFKEKSLEAAGVDPWGVDISVEASGAEPCMHAGIAFVHSGGTYVQAGLGRPINSMPTLSIVAKELDVVGSVRYTAGCFQTAISLLASGRIDIKPMITAVFPLSKSKDALEAVRRGSDLKVVIMNQQV